MAAVTQGQVVAESIPTQKTSNRGQRNCNPEQRSYSALRAGRCRLRPPLGTAANCVPWLALQRTFSTYRQAWISSNIANGSRNEPALVPSQIGKTYSNKR